jgi:quercetin dioxygenase-like cupin family protein
MLPAALGVLAVLWAVPATAQGQAAQDDSAFVTTRSGALEWNAVTPEGFDKGMEMAVVRGDPSVAEQPYVLRLRLPDGYRFPPHWHPVPENVTVLEGTFHLGMGERRDASRIERYRPGDHLFIEAQHPHFGGASGRTVLQLHGPGPFEIVTVGTPEDSQRRKAAATR